MFFPQIKNGRNAHTDAIDYNRLLKEKETAGHHRPSVAENVASDKYLNLTKA
jgi:hypothetical protein